MADEHVKSVLRPLKSKGCIGKSHGFPEHILRKRWQFDPEADRIADCFERLKREGVVGFHKTHGTWVVWIAPSKVHLVDEWLR